MAHLAAERNFRGIYRKMGQRDIASSNDCATSKCRGMHWELQPAAILGQSPAGPEMQRKKILAKTQACVHTFEPIQSYRTAVAV
jgi:hypothetical protein